MFIIFSVLSELTPRHHLQRVKVSVYAHKYDFEPMFDFPGVSETARGAAFLLHETPKGEVPHYARSVLEPTSAQFGAENDPRTHFHRTGIVFCSLWERFLNYFRHIMNATFQKSNAV